MEITERLLDSARMLNRFIVPRYITGRLIRFARREDIASRFSELEKFSFNEIIETLNHKNDYRLQDPVRQKMIASLINLFLECGYMRKDGNMYSWLTGRNERMEKEINLGDEETALLSAYFENQVSFIEKCLSYAATFLRGGAHLYSFDGDSLDIWDSFLGNVEFSFARQLLLLNLRIKNTPDFKFLDIGYGPGYGILSAHELYPEIEIVAIDFAGSFTFLVKEKLETMSQFRESKNNSSKPVKLVSNGMWKGFGYSLPFPDESFNAILFSCADPYIPPDLRGYVYSEVYRVLRHGGALGILTRAYPDPGFRYVKNHWTRMAAYCHDFAESVCKGWHGFYDIEESFALFKKIGFSKGKKTANDISMLDSALWILDKD